MPQTQDEFHALMQKVLAGSEEAAQELFRDYEPFLLLAIRRRLSKRIRSKFDSNDFAQDVWASFFAESSERRCFNSPEELVAFLTTLAQNKVIDTMRQRVKSQKHNVEREESLDDSTRFDKDFLTAQQPTPSQVLMTQEEWVEFLRKQPLVYRRIFILLREGKTHVEIAKELGIDLRTIHRTIYRAAPKGSS